MFAGVPSNLKQEDTVMNDIKPIETIYNDYRFRSRLEARWAVFFDALGVIYRYETEGFDLGNGLYYLPDFYLPASNWWVEIKGVMNNTDLKKIDAFGEHHNIVVLGDIPAATTEDTRAWVERNYSGWESFRTPYDFPYLPCICPKCGKFGFEFDGRGARICGDTCCPDDDKGYTYDDPAILRAYRIARQARFEHGETPIF